MKRVVSYLLLISFVCQIGNSIAIGNILEKILHEVCAYYSDETGLSFFDSVYQDGMCETEQNEEETMKNLCADLFFKSSESNSSYSLFERVQKSYLTFSALLPSGFYFSLIQPPD